ncbi:MAG: hypothetical protein ACO3GU_02230 [Pelagibacteraceae bacterium]
MADLSAKIVPLKTETAGLAPTDAQCDVGEIAINLTDRKIFSKRSDGTIVTLAGGSKIQDSEDFGLNPIPTQGYRYGTDGPADIAPGYARYATNFTSPKPFIIHEETSDGVNIDALLRVMVPGDPFWWSFDGGITFEQFELLSITEGASGRWDLRPTVAPSGSWSSSNDSAPERGFDFILTLAPPGGLQFLALEFGDAVVWTDHESLGPAFRPRSFKAHQLLDIEAPASTVDGYVLQWSEADQLYKHQALAFNISAAADYTGAAPNLGEVLTWDGAKWDAQALGGGLAINDLTDVNTATVAPLDGQALVWSQANGYWRPGEVASGANALDDLTDVTITTPAAGKVIRYNGTAWVDAVLSYQDLSNKPTLVTTLAGLTDTDLSLAPTQGQVLTWDGSAWAPADPTGGGAGGSVAGALTERADETQATASIADGVTAALAFVGLGVSGNFTQVTTSAAAWVRFYPTDADRIADSTRDIGTDPAPGSGVLLEVITTAAGETVKVTPSASYFNNDDPADPFLYCAVRNLSGATATVSVTVRAYSQVIASLVSGGTFGSG